MTGRLGSAIAGLVGALLTSLAGSALAAPTAAQMEECVRRFPGDREAERRACFESLLAPASATAPPATPPSPPSAAPPRPAPAAAIALDRGESGSPFRRLWGDAKERSAWRAGEYQTNYFLPAYHARRPNLAPAAVGGAATAPIDPALRQATEAKFQLSLKGHVWPKDDRGSHDLWFGYTQVSHWQLWNDEASRPFRESSYEPEILYTWEPKDWRAGTWRVGHLGLSLNHNSNGRGGDGSRSWNRVIGFVRAESGGTMVTVRGWGRIEESGKDDNPRIADHYGRADVQVTHEFANGALLSALARHSLRGGSRSRGALQLDLSLPLCRSHWPAWACVDSLRAHAQVFHGHAESLIDYNHRDTYFGLGFSIGETP